MGFACIISILLEALLVHSKAVIPISARGIRSYGEIQFKINIYDVGFLVIFD